MIDAKFEGANEAKQDQVLREDLFLQNYKEHFSQRNKKISAFEDQQRKSQRSSFFKGIKIPLPTSSTPGSVAQELSHTTSEKQIFA